jgi:Ca2+-binding EF-hand superfamily protein
MTIGGTTFNTQDAATVRQNIFNTLDQNGDGKVTKDELQSAFASRQSAGANSSQGPSLDDLFSRIDTNGDGSIDESENDAFLESAAKNRQPQGPPDPSQIAKKLFEKADTDGDGKLTKSELAAALPKHGHGHGKSGAAGASGASSSSALDDLFNDADSDGDGAITESELQASLEKRLQRFTSYNQNGNVTTSAAGISQTLGVA